MKLHSIYCTAILNPSFLYKWITKTEPEGSKREHKPSIVWIYKEARSGHHGARKNRECIKNDQGVVYSENNKDGKDISNKSKKD